MGMWARSPSSPWLTYVLLRILPQRDKLGLHWTTTNDTVNVLAVAFPLLPKAQAVPSTWGQGCQGAQLLWCRLRGKGCGFPSLSQHFSWWGHLSGGWPRPFLVAAATAHIITGCGRTRDMPVGHLGPKQILPCLSVTVRRLLAVISGDYPPRAMISQGC